MNPSFNRRTFLKAAASAAAAQAATSFGASVASGRDDRRVRLGFIGVGGRGSGLLRNCLAMRDVEIPAICDLLEKNLQRALAAVEKSGRARPEGYAKGEEDFRNLVQRDDLDGVIIATPWEWHIPMAIAAMKAGKYAAPEVGPASSLEECWELVRTFEQTRVPCMLLENVCFDRTHMALLRMVREGLFGELIHCQCGYQHDLRQRIVQGKGTGVTLKEGGDFRTKHNRERNGELYPTHPIGPVANWLNIDRGNRFVSLTATASKSRGLNDWAARNLGPDHPSARIRWAEGDIVTTVIKCHHGETVVMTHDCALPRPVPAESTARLQGTRGIWERARGAIFLDKPGRRTAEKWEPFASYQARYEHPLWQRYVSEGVRAGHGGIDYLTLRAFADSVKERRPPPIDVYDAACWMAIAPLSEKSIAGDSVPVKFPDFTSGRWATNKPIFGVEPV